MDAVIKEKWVAALKSGDYEQGKGTLHSKTEGKADKFCCLGVLCDILIKEGLWKPEIRETRGIDDKVKNVYYNDEPGVLPYEARDIAGLVDGNPLVVVEFTDEETGCTGNYEQSLAQLNDEGKTFSEIADLIDTQL